MTNESPLASTTYLDGHDIRYLSPAEEGRFGLPAGNGDLAAMLWTPKDRLEIAVNKSNSWDDAPDSDNASRNWYPIAEEGQTALVSCAHLCISNGLPAFDDTYLDDFEARLHLREGFVSIDSRSPLCTTQARAYVVRDPDVLVVDYADKTEEPVAREIVLSRFGSRAFPHWYSALVRDTRVRLDGTQAGGDGTYAWIEQKLRRISFAVVARFVGSSLHMDRPNSHIIRLALAAAQEVRGQLYVAVVTSEESADPLAEAKKRVDRAVALGLPALQAANARRWQEFWSRSFVRIPDPYIENLYYFSLYQMGACAGNPDYPPFVYGAQWLTHYDETHWAYFHWTLQQLTWPVHAAGHPELARGYNEYRFRGLGRARALARKVHGIGGAFYTDIGDRDGRLDCDPQTGGHLNHNLTPGSQIAMDLWRHYQYTGDEEFLRTRAYPLMVAAAQFYLEYMVRDEQGTYHVPQSVGYEGHLLQRDCVPDMAVIRQSFAACIEASERLGVDPDLRARWRDVLDHLAPFVITEHEGQKVVATGIMADEGHEFTRNVPYKMGEAVFFRGFWLPLALAYPSGAIGLAQEGSELFEAARSAVRIVGPTAAGGWIASAIPAARLGMAREALEWLTWYVKHCQRLPQGFMQEGVADSGPTDIWATVTPNVIRDGKRTDEKAQLLSRRHDVAEINCNCNVMTTVQEMLFQSHDRVLRIFPAVPDAWGDVAFRLHAVGGFIVAAMRKAGATVYVRVESPRGGLARLGNPWPGREVAIVAQGESEPLFLSSATIIEFQAQPGGVYTLRPQDEMGELLPALDWQPPAAGPRLAYDRRLGIPRYF